jgi:3-methyladenine DNA glycosylase AlkD
MKNTKRKKESSMPERLFQATKRALSAEADPKKAAAMQAYMKSEMPYYGVPMPELRTLCRSLLARYPLKSEEEWTEAVLTLWREASHREQRYVAIELAAAGAYEPFRTLEALPVYEEMIVTGAWWDFVDPLAANHVGELLRRYPREIGRTMRVWAKCDDNWKRRASILCQLKFKHHTNQRLLYHNIEQSMEVPNFFLRKAIGWALREYAKTEPTEVRRYVTAHAKQLHPLSRREAMKNLESFGGPPLRGARASGAT